MIYLFCSAATALYKQDALDCTCYPEGHIFRFRYSKNYVQPEIWEKTNNFENKDGVMVFLDTVGSDRKKDFNFYPVRKIKTIRFYKEGSALYVDFKFGSFINYGPKDEIKLSTMWDTFFKKLHNHPWPKPEKSGRKETEQGFFILSNLESSDPEFPTTGSIPNEQWDSVIARLDKTDKTEGLGGSTFFHILGFYKLKRDWLHHKINLTKLIPPYQEVLIKATDNSYDSFYPLPMGKSVVLKLLLSRPSYDPNDQRKLELTAGEDSFAGLSQDIVHSNSRYNQERIILICKRVFDSVLSSVSIKQQDSKDIQAPQAFLLTRMKVPRRIVGVVVGGVVFSALLLSFDPISIERLGLHLLPKYADFIKQNAGFLSGFCKVLAVALAGISGFLAFRRLPLK